MAQSGASTGTRSAPRVRSPFDTGFVGNRAGIWPLLFAAAAAGPMTGLEIMLLSKPLGGDTGLPGAVVGYIALTALALAVAAIAAASRWPVITTARRAGVVAVVAAAGSLVAGAVPAIGALTAGILAAGAAAGPLLVTVRAVAGVRGFHLVMSGGALAGALTTAALSEHPRVALLISGGVAGGAGLLAAVLNPPLGVGRAATLRACLREVREYRWVYGAAGFVVGGTVLPALHLLLFRFSVLDADQPPYLAAALVAPAAVAGLAGYRRSALAPLLILAAGGPLLVATAPGPWHTAIGVAVTLAAAVRVTAVADALLRERMSADTRVTSAVAISLVSAVGGFAGLAAAAGLGHLWGTGTALTLLAPVVLVAALTVTGVAARRNERGRVASESVAAQEVSSEGEVR